MKLFALLFCSIILVSSCSSSGSDNDGEANPDSTALVSTDTMKLPTGVIIEVERRGDGVMPVQGQMVSVHYKGSLENGQVFDESYGRNEPLRFKIGTGQLIPGWEQAIARLSKGAKAKLTIPADMAYGEHERPGIPANSTLIFDVEVVDIEEAPEPIVHEVFPTEGLKMQTTESGLQYYIIEEGTGVEATPGKTVKVHYHGMLEDGTKFDASYDRGEAFEFPLGAQRVIPGWEEGIALLSEGAKAKLIIPPHLAYGPQGAGEVIPPNATIIFDVELLEVK